MLMRCTTLLDAVNICLEGIGEQPVNTIPSSGVTEATIAYNIVHRVSREVQNKGLHCNTEENYPFIPDIQGRINIPQNVISIDPSDRSLDCVVRGELLYNRKDHTFSFSSMSKVECNVTWFLQFEELPEHVRNYIAVRSARLFQRSYLGSTNLNAMSQEDEFNAKVNFMREEDLTDDRTMLESNPVSNILNRRA